MKRQFLFLAGSAFALSSYAQQQDGHSHLSDKFGVSVFHKSHTLTPENRADGPTHAKLSAQFPGWMIGTDQWTGGFRELNGKPIAVPGSSWVEKATYLMNNQLSAVGIQSSEWTLKETFTNNKGFTYLYYEQVVAGQKVLFTKLHFRFTPDGKISRINMMGYGQPDTKLKTALAADKAIDVASGDLDDAILTQKTADKDLVWFPIPGSKGYQIHPSYRIHIEGHLAQNHNIPINIIAYVDAVDGSLLYRDNETKDAVNLKVEGSVFTNGILNPAQKVGIMDMNVTFGTTTLITNDTGFVSSSSITMPATATVSLQGPWSRVRSAPDGNITPSFTKTISSLGTKDSFATSTRATSRHINAFYHVNTIHDHMKAIYGSAFTGMDFALTTNVDVSGTCNAFYTAASGGSINFFPSGGGCVSFAEVRDVVYHEYGHAIVSRMYSGGMTNGGLNEGQADVWAMSITKDSILARGANFSAGSFIRRYDLAPKVFPRDLVGQVHADGEIIAGAWWDYGKNVKSVDSMGKLFAETLLNEKPDGPNGTEGVVYHEMLIGALINDDNDADLSNGTPHMTEIVTAFARHGIYLLQDIKINHSELAHQAAGSPISVNATATVSNPAFFKDMFLVYRERGSSWNTIKMVDAGGFNFSATIPAMGYGTIVDYYFAIEDIVNQQGVFAPANFYPSTVVSENKSTLSYQFAVGVFPKLVVDFESPLDPDWKLGLPGDNATMGIWIQAKPIGTANNGLQVQTNNDHTTGFGQCLVTGNALGSAYTQSVRNGMTTVQTPVFSIKEYSNPIVEYYRWFSNDRGRHPKKEIWRVSMTTTSTSVFFRDVDNTNQSDHQWRRRLFKPRDLFPGTDQMMLKFLATENIPSGSTQNGLVEAAIDDFVIYEGTETASVKNLQTDLAKIYPNPTQDFIKVELPASVQQANIKFFDLQGRHISTVPTSAGNHRYQIDLSEMVPGQYLLVIEMNKTIQNHIVTIAR